jgi:Cd2+/Zn2+-exporting ATPase
MKKQNSAHRNGEVLTLSLESLNIADEQMLQSRLQSVPGILQVDLSLFEGTLEITYSGEVLQREDVLDLVKQPDLLLRRSQRSPLRKWLDQYGIFMVMIMAILLTLVSLTLATLDPDGYAFPRPLYLVLNGLVVLLGSASFYRAFSNLFKKSVVNTDLLVVCTVVCTLIMQLWTEAALICLLAIVAGAFSKAVLRYTSNSSPLSTVLGTRKALVKQEDGFVEIPVSELKEGQCLLVKQGMMIPVDGRISSGMAEILEASITGESSFRVREQGDTVYAGCIAQYGTFEMIAEKVGDSISLSYIEKLIHYAATRKTVRQSMVDSVTRIFLYIMIPLVLLMTVIFGQFIGWENAQWVYRSFKFALTALVALSPFALVLATPTSVYAGIRKAAGLGIVYKSGNDIERLRDMNALLLDKTGTLTYAEPEVAAIVPFGDAAEEDVLRAAVMIEQNSNHPIAHAVMRYGSEHAVPVAPADRFLEFEGGGACAVRAGEHYKIGSLWLMQDGREIPDEVTRWLEESSSKGLTPILVSDHKRVLGGIALEDRVREDALETIRALRRIGIRRLVMVTGDNAATARRIGERLELDDVVPECMPSDKISQLNKERSMGFIPGMVGDGINDAPALAAAEVGIAMGAMGSDVAIKSADVALLRKDFGSLYDAIKIGHQIIHTVNFNIALALIVDILMVGFVLLGAIDLASAIMAQIAVVVIVMLTSLHLYVRRL